MREAPRFEENIVWLADLADLDYVRESEAFAERPRGPIEFRGPGRLVGYSELRSDAPSTGGPGPASFLRRVFWLKPYDRGEGPDATYAAGTPAEAVDPRTVSPGVPGWQTCRSWFADRGPFSNEALDGEARE